MSDAIGYWYDERSKCVHARYTGYDGKRMKKRFYLKDYTTREDAEMAAKQWYRENSQRIIEQIQLNGPCRKKHKSSKKMSNTGEHGISDQTERNRFCVKLERSNHVHRKQFNYNDDTKETVLNEAIAWRNQIYVDYPKAIPINKKQKFNTLTIFE